MAESAQWCELGPVGLQYLLMATIVPKVKWLFVRLFCLLHHHSNRIEGSMALEFGGQLAGLRWAVGLRYRYLPFPAFSILHFGAVLTICYSNFALK